MDCKDASGSGENTRTTDIDTDCDTENESILARKKIIKTTNVVKPAKKVKRGIIYLSTIPKYMNIAMIREMFSAYGKVGRVYLQLAENG